MSGAAGRSHSAPLCSAPGRASRRVGRVQLGEDRYAEGVVSKVDWVNPHIFVYFDAKDENGKVTTWRLQSVPPMFFKGSGLTKEKLLDGSEATVTLYPAKDGTDGFGFLLKLSYPDGHFYNLGGGAAPPPAPAK